SPRKRLAQLTLLALGVVYGDIGTSPLYAFRECFIGQHGVAPIAANVYGILSLIVWTLILIVAVKYIIFIMRADNGGEGGILALLALLIQRHGDSGGRWRGAIIALGLIGASLLYGDGVITPAISVLSAVEGLKIVTPSFDKFVLPATVVILVLLFLLQRRGTEVVGKIFGPIMTFWFITIGLLGAIQIVHVPQVLVAFNPWYAAHFMITYGRHAFILLGAVVLVVTGAEALYADMGHFGKPPIRIAWFSLVLPALLLNYFGQGALVLRNPLAATSPFYLLAPRLLLYPLILLATVATVIASQALISGAFSLAQQSVQLGYMPRVRIIHTSKQEVGQIYVPEINRLLMVGCLLVVLSFRSSAALSAAYGIAVTGTMAITTVLFTILAYTQWRWGIVRSGLFLVVFLTIDLSFFAANALKLESGGWVPIAIALVIFTAMTTWHRGRAILGTIHQQEQVPLPMLLQDIATGKIVRVRGTAVFMTPTPEGAPIVLLHHLKHNKVIHEQVVLLTVNFVEIPEVPDEERITVTILGSGFARVQAQYGFMETPNVTKIMALCAEHGIKAPLMETTYYLGRERLLATGTSKMAHWRKVIYIFLAHNARPATEFFGIPSNRVVELGAQITI
ncbi:MAG TPA: potassium transporter Kup, partial [Gemmatimonadaceae bacterium]|nr:potassium transporter Kup [Gemmatimonadaceae bacterium]